VDWRCEVFKDVGIFCDEALTLLDPSYWRFYLLSIRPERKDIAFSWEDLDNAVNGILNNNILNLVNRTVTLAHKKTAGRIPDAQLDAELLERVRATAEKVSDIIEGGLLAPALREVSHLAIFGNEYVQQNQPWKDGHSHHLAGALHLAKALAVLLEPFVPKISHKVYDIFNLHDVRYEEATTVRGGHALNAAQPLFEKLDIDDLKARYEALKKQTA